nr:MAG TPA: hypothetical protein [Caudoviricetes sp.]
MNDSVQKFQNSKLNREYKYGWKNSIPLGLCAQKSLLKIDFYINLFSVFRPFGRLDRLFY